MLGEKEILQKLVVDEKDTIRDLERLVNESSKFFKIEKPTGRIIFVNFGDLSDPKRICIVMIGKYFANKLELVESPNLSISDIAKEIGKPMTTLSSPMRDLTKKGYVEKLPGRKYRIAYHRISEILEKVLTNKRD